MPNVDFRSLKVRLYVDVPLGVDRRLELSGGQAHYLTHVMRLGVGSSVAVFNGRDGEWCAVVENKDKRSCVLRAVSCLRTQTGVPDLWLLFAPVKRSALSYLVQKATELGSSRLKPIRTTRTVVARVNEARLHANMVEAAEQSGRMCVPDLMPFDDLGTVLESWDGARKLMFCDESGDDSSAPWGGRRGRAGPVGQVLAREDPGPWAILLGPEGGFSAEERRQLRSLPYVVPVSLGPRIMRADTAAFAALSVWQSVLGDWQGQWPP